MASKRIARVFPDAGGWYICDDANDYLDTRGFVYRTRASAIHALRNKAMHAEQVYLGPGGCTVMGDGTFTHYRAPDGRAVKLVKGV